MDKMHGKLDPVAGMSRYLMETIQTIWWMGICIIRMAIIAIIMVPCR